MELRHIRYFLAVARHANFTHAAAELGIVQPALSQQIKQLEDELGILLFDRTSRRPVLTRAGEAFLERSERIMGDLENVLVEMHDFSGTVKGRVAVGSMFTLGLGPLHLPSLLAAFHEHYQDVQVILEEASTEGLLEMLRTGKVDLALLDLALLEDVSDLAIEPITSENLVVLVGPKHPLASRGGVALADLAQQPFIKLSSPSATRMRRILQACDAAGFHPNFVFAPASTVMARALVAEGLGIFITHRWVAEGEGPPVVAVELVPPPFRCDLSLVWPKKRYQSAAVSAFIAFGWDRLHFRSAAGSTAHGAPPPPLRAPRPPRRSGPPSGIRASHR